MNRAKNPPVLIPVPFDYHRTRGHVVCQTGSEYIAIAEECGRKGQTVAAAHYYKLAEVAFTKEK